MKVLELFAGSCSVGKAAKELGAEVFSSDIRSFERLAKGKAETIHYKVNIHDFDPKQVPFIPDVIWASPPCTSFSIASCWKHWTGPKGGRIPATQAALDGIAIVKKTLEVINHLKPKFWFMENPRGMLRKQDFMQDYLRQTVTYCQYGDFRMKPTDIWTNCKVWEPRPMCKNGQPCHESSARGEYSSVMRQSNSYERSKIPHDLCMEILSVCKSELKKEKKKEDKHLKNAA